MVSIRYMDTKVNIVVMGIAFTDIECAGRISRVLNSGKRLYNDKVNQLMSFIYW